MKNMNRLWLVIQREYISIVARKSFIVMTILIPLLSIGGMGLPWLLASINGGDQQRVAIVDESHRLAKSIADNEDYKFEDITPIGAKGIKDFYDNADGLYAVVVVPAHIDSTLALNVYSKNAVKSSLSKHIKDCLNPVLMKEKVSSFNVEGLQSMIDRCNVNIDVNSIQWNDEGGEAESHAAVASIIGLVLALLTYMFVLMYGAMIMNSVVEEKTNRIVEVIVSSCRPLELMLGKIIGVGLVGLSQIAIWLVIGIIAFSALGLGALTEVTAASSGDYISMAMQILSTINFAQIITSFILYFLGGFLLYAALFAAFGSAVDQPSDASQFTTPIIMIMVFAIWAAMACIENPDGQLAVWCSMIPFTSPIVMMVRLPYNVPLWQLATSVVILFATALAITAFAARIYRRGILMYGKKVSFAEMLKWLK